MSRTIRIETREGETLRARLFERGVEFPCGGVQRCGACRIRVVEGQVPVTNEMREALSDDELRAGWRLGCFAQAQGAVTIEVEQWSAPVLTGTERVNVEPHAGRGIAIDLGTTTLAAQLVDLRDGNVLRTITALNPQAQHGADLMSRIAYEREHAGELGRLIRAALGAMVDELAKDEELEEVLVCGNTAMHHLFCGYPVDTLACAPFRTPHLGAWSGTAGELGWHTRVRGAVTMLANIGGFVGSDILAGLIACDVAHGDAVVAFADLGTNGEIALGSRNSIVCASTAAGPAFEAGRIRHGMRAGTSAIDRVEWRDGTLHCNVIGGGAARGLCGSGLVDAAAALLDAGLLQPSGRLANGVKQVALSGDVALTQADVRELQLAKGAIAAGTLLLRTELNAPVPQRLHLAGAFGNYVRAASATRIGLLPTGTEIVAEGNTALRGTRLLLLHPQTRAERIAETLARTRHIELARGATFEEAYATCMRLGEIDWTTLDNA